MRLFLKYTVNVSITYTVLNLSFSHTRTYFTLICHDYFKCAHTFISVLFTKFQSDDQIQKNEMGGGHMTHVGEKRGAHRVFVGKPEGKNI